jgi:hypothetical protein
MQLGDLIEYQDSRYVVRRHHKSAKTFTVEAGDGRTITIPDSDDVKILGNTLTDWCILAATSTRVRKAPFWVVTEAPTNSIRGKLLTNMVDWVRSGGSIFLSPSLDLTVGDTITIQGYLYPEEKMLVGSVALRIPASFSTLAEKVRKATVEPEEPETVYSRFMRDTSDF